MTVRAGKAISGKLKKRKENDEKRKGK